MITKVLVVDDDAASARAIARALVGDGFTLTVVSSPVEALSRCESETFDVVVTELVMPGLDGVELVARLHAIDARLPIIICSAVSEAREAVRASRAGSFAYLVKPCSGDALRAAIHRAVEHRRKVRERRRERLPAALVGSSAVMRELDAKITQLAESDEPVLLRGERGSGRSTVAREIHLRSARAAQPFVTASLFEIPGPLLASELFGHVVGGVPGADGAKRGLARAAQPGTLFLASIDALDEADQEDVAALVERRVVRPVGSKRERDVDVRVLAASCDELGVSGARDGAADRLRDRFTVLSVPSLAARVDDMPALVAATFDAVRARHPHASATTLGSALLERMCARRWPGNLTELEMTVEAMVRIARGPELLPRHLAYVSDHGGAPDEVADEPTEKVDDVVWRHVQAVLARTEGNKTRAAKMLGIDPATLYRWIRRKE